MSLREHGHDHTADGSNATAGADASTRRLALVAAVNFVGFVVELLGGLLFGSLALLGDAIHMLFDTLAYLMAFGASYTAERFEGDEAWSYGLHRLEPAAALVNGVLLVPMVGYILWEASRRFLAPVRIDPLLTLVVATGGLLVNLGSVYVLHGDEMSLNERGAFSHLLGDAGGSVAVIVSTIAVAVFDAPIADPAAALLVSLLILWSAGRVLSESASILLQRSPVDLSAVRADLAGLDGVERVEDVHVWQVCSRLTVGTARIVDGATTLERRQRIQERVHDRLAAHGVDHATVELTGTAEEGGRTADAS